MKYDNENRIDFSFTDINKLIHEPARLTIMAHLYVIDSADFIFLMGQTGLTKGNLSSHLCKLEKADYVDIDKEFVDKIPRTLLKLTKKGREAFNLYRESMKQAFNKLPE
jgi:DNA-binding MarR family transcriptional regulator